MLRRCCIVRSGHGDLFPTSKAAAHLNLPFVMGREVPPPPGKDRCYAEFCTPEVHRKFQTNAPEVHAVKAVSTRSPFKKELHHCATERPSEASIEATLAGVSGALNHHHTKTNETPMARANIAAKLAAERHAKTRDFMEHKRTPRERSAKYAGENAIEYPAAQFFVEERVNRLRKMENTNPSGFVREYMLWEPKPPPPPPPKK
ncbi:hypothetical protein ABB37_06110 [Leptomonas pyrrhocoris]|uniref:Uncharacterized protein n=1 Tax=Leptomonas pyrrhocoris TaxID=157538 RepID=A0A0M9FYI8_LEPPY|nr:hypothetical protein ABB37_06110 [Leptomonas pyrrhocoris]KPA78496.1 hypothetical protein ABB37_06110 [Leptomonas pyrrhocoris]|eukprot:XP_015656935.1 hypothetical protein ABB37_06110 [Leptomonas pyrrhocoris]